MMDLGIPIHNSMVKIWKYTNEKIEDKLEDLRAEKEVMKALNREFMEYIRSIFRITSSIQFDPNLEENKNLLPKLQQER